MESDGLSLFSLLYSVLLDSVILSELLGLVSGSVSDSEALGCVSGSGVLDSVSDSVSL